MLGVDGETERTRCECALKSLYERAGTRSLEQQIEEAEERMRRNLTEAVFGADEVSPAAPLRPIPWRFSLAVRWYAAREWVAKRVLRVELASDQEEW